MSPPHVASGVTFLDGTEAGTDAVAVFGLGFEGAFVVVVGVGFDGFELTSEGLAWPGPGRPLFGVRNVVLWPGSGGVV